MRSLYYLLMAAAEDEETQKHGLTIITMNLGSSRKISIGSLQAVPKIVSLLRVLPVKLASGHYCFENALQAKMASFILFSGPRSFRSRLKAHHGM